MSGVEAISFEEVECGRKIAETKKRFKWRLKIDGNPVCIELVNSTLSGKREILIDSISIYSEQKLLNIDFEFNHNLMNHFIRISKKEGSMTDFQFRVDNQTFDQLKYKFNGNRLNQKELTKSKFQKTETDPFAEFSSFANKSKIEATKPKNDFGDFDFDEVVSMKKASSPIESNLLPPKLQINEVDLLQTNGVGNFANIFQNNYASQMVNEDSFATNNFQMNNVYIDLLDLPPEKRSEQWTDTNLPVQTVKKGFFGEAIENFSVKQTVNKIKMTADQIKTKITQSLI